MFYRVLSHRDINRAFKGYVCKCMNVIALAVSFVPRCYRWWGWAQSGRYEAAPMIILVVHRLIEPCLCVLLFGHCTCEKCSCPWHVLHATASSCPGNTGFPAPISGKSLSPAPFNPTAGMHPHPIAVGRESGGLLSAFFPQIPLDRWGTVVGKTAQDPRKGESLETEIPGAL